MFFTLQPNRWYGMQLWEDHAIHHSPIRVRGIRPLKTGANELGIDFFHASYPQGVQDKSYRLRILFRAKTYLLAHSTQHDDNRCVWIGALTSEWLKPHMDERLAHAIELEPNLDICLDRFFHQQTD